MTYQVVTSIFERFQEKYIPEPNSGCWLWFGANTGEANPYGAMKVGKKNQLAHRISYELFCSSVPNGMHVLHRCDNSYCVNPEHLFLGSHAENMSDMKTKGRGNACRGVEHVKAKLTPEKASEIRQLVASGKTHKEVTAIYGVSRGLVSMVVRGEMWSS